MNWLGIFFFSFLDWEFGVFLYFKVKSSVNLSLAYAFNLSLSLFFDNLLKKFLSSNKSFIYIRLCCYTQWQIYSPVCVNSRDINFDYFYKVCCSENCSCYRIGFFSLKVMETLFIYIYIFKNSNRSVFHFSKLKPSTLFGLAFNICYLHLS